MHTSEPFDLTASESPSPALGRRNRSAIDTPVRVREMSELRASIPYLLGFYPERSLVMLALQQDGKVAVTARIDAPQTAEDAVAAIDQVAPVLRRCSPKQVLVAYCDEYELSEADEGAREHIVSSALRFYQTVRDLGPVLERELRANGFTAQLLWPQEPGMPRSSAGPVPQIAVANAVAGRRLLRNRSEVRMQLEPIGGTTRKLIREQIAALQAVPLARMDLIALVTDIVDGYAQATESSGCSAPTEARHVAICAIALRDVMIRDLLIILIAQERAWWQPDLWCRAVRLAPTADVAALATMAAVTAYLNGDGALAQSACDRALECDPEYSLASMIADSLRLGILPQELQEMLATMLDPQDEQESL